MEYDYIYDTQLETVWFIRTAQTALQIAAHLKKAMDDDDRLIVTKMVANSYNGQMHKDIWPWISNNL